MGKTKTKYDTSALDAAKILDMHPGTLANWRAKGIGPAFEKTGDGKNARVLYSSKGLREFAKTLRRSIARR